MFGYINNFFTTVRKFLSTILVYIASIIYTNQNIKNNTETDLVWIGYITSLNNILPVDRMELPITNYIDMLTIASINYYAKNKTLTKEKFDKVKDLWFSFINERPQGNYYISGSGFYKVTLTDQLNLLFSSDYDKVIELLLKYDKEN